MKRLLSMLCCGAVLAGCSGHGAGMLPPGNSPANNVGPGVRPPVLSASFIRSAGRIEAPNVPLRETPRFLKNMGVLGAKPMTTVLPGDLEQVGVAIQPGGTYAGIFAAQTAYTNAFVQIGFPSGSSGTSTLYAPLVIPSNKSCLGTGEVYSNAGTGTSASFFVVDVCAGAIPFATPINSLFAQTYTRISARGVPELLSVAFSTDAAPSASSVWYALLYNYTASRWDLITQKTGISGNGTGVSLWLSTFVVGQCPSTPVIAADSMFLYNAANGTYETLQPTMAQTTTSVITTAPTCFLPDGSGPQNFVFALSTPNSSWGVVASPPAPFLNEYPILTGNGFPSGIVAGPDGNIWFTEQSGNKIGRITTGGLVTEFPVPTANSSPDGITAGPDGNLWFTEVNGNKIGRITSSGTITEFTVSTANSIPPGITAGPDGNLWFTEFNGNKIGRITPSGAITEFPVTTAGSGPSGITTGADGNLWFAEEGGKIGRITPSGTVTEFIVPTANSDPVGITAGPDGNVWFAETIGKIGRITPGGTVTEFVVPTASSLPTAVTAGPDGNLWFTEKLGNNIGRITVGGAATEFAVPTANAQPLGITTGADGNLYFTEVNKIGRTRP